MEDKYKTGLKRFLAVIVDGLVFTPLIVIEEFYIRTTGDLIIIATWTLLFTVISFLYSILLHAKYGQTLGKMAVKVKVVDISETKNIGLKQAFLRDSVWVAITIAGIIYFITLTTSKGPLTENIINSYDDFTALTGLIWIVLELLTMLTNHKRRAIHDFIARTVVVKT